MACLSSSATGRHPADSQSHYLQRDVHCRCFHRKHTRTHARTHTHVCTHTRTHACTHACMHMCTTSLKTDTHTQSNTQTLKSIPCSMRDGPQLPTSIQWTLIHPAREKVYISKCGILTRSSVCTNVNTHKGLPPRPASCQGARSRVLQTQTAERVWRLTGGRASGLCCRVCFGIGVDSRHCVLKSALHHSGKRREVSPSLSVSLI